MITLMFTLAAAALLSRVLLAGQARREAAQRPAESAVGPAA
jgi:hypothetical protein